MKVQVNTNGYEESEGTHISVYVYTWCQGRMKVYSAINIILGCCG